jgi:hypothetical protein
MDIETRRIRKPASIVDGHALSQRVSNYSRYFAALVCLKGWDYAHNIAKPNMDIYAEKKLAIESLKEPRGSFAPTKTMRSGLKSQYRLEYLGELLDEIRHA